MVEWGWGGGVNNSILARRYHIARPSDTCNLWAWVGGAEHSGGCDGKMGVRDGAGDESKVGVMD